MTRRAQMPRQSPRQMLHGRVHPQAYRTCLQEKLDLERLLAEQERHKDLQHLLLYLLETRRQERDLSRARALSNRREGGMQTDLRLTATTTPSWTTVHNRERLEREKSTWKRS